VGLKVSDSGVEVADRGPKVAGGMGRSWSGCHQSVALGRLVPSAVTAGCHHHSLLWANAWCRGGNSCT